jgi:hypothetical protein
VPLELLEIESHTRCEMNADPIRRVAFVAFDSGYFRSAIQKSFPKEKSNCQLLVITRGSHRHRNRADRSDTLSLKSNLDFQGLLDGDLVPTCRCNVVRYAADLNASGVGGTWHLRSPLVNTYHIIEVDKWPFTQKPIRRVGDDWSLASGKPEWRLKILE